MTDPWTRTFRRRAIAVDLFGLALGLAGYAAVVTAAVIVLGGLAGALLCGGASAMVAAVAVMRRDQQVPDLVAPRLRRVPDGPDEDTAAGQPYAPARDISDGAPRSPITGL